MKQTKQMEKIQEKMRPGVITLSGFLGTDSRNLNEILTSDEAEVRRLEVTYAQIASRMIEMRDAGMRGAGGVYKRSTTL